MADNTAVLKISADVAAAKAALTDIKKEVQGFSDEVKKMASQSKSSWALMSAGIASVIYSIQQVVQQASYFTNAYMEAEKASMKMGVAMKNQGDYTDEAREGMEEYAAQIQRTTAFEDDFVLSMMANLKTYGMTNDEVKTATKTILDFATAKRDEGMTVEKAGELIGKAYQGQTERLKRYGIVIDESIPKSEQFDAVLKQLNARFSGAAQADLETYSGQWQQLKNQFQDVAEVIGIGLIKALQALMYGFSVLSVKFWESVESIAKGVTWLSEKIGGFADALGMTGVAASIGSFTATMKSSQEIYTGTKNAALNMASANYTAMMSFESVSKAIAKMKSGSRTKSLLGGAGAGSVTDELTKLLEKWEAVKESLTTKTETAGLDQFDKKIGDIIVMAEKLSKEFAAIPEAQGIIDTWAESEIAAETLKQTLETAKEITAETERQAEIVQEQYDTSKAIQLWGVEKEINELKRQKSQYLISEAGYIQKEIDLTNKLLAIEQARIDQGIIDPGAYDEAIKKVRELTEKLKDLGVQLKQNSDDMAGGFLEGLRAYNNEIGDLFKQGVSTAKDACNAIEGELSDVFGDAMKGDMHSFKEYFQSFTDALVDVWADAMAKMVMEWVTSLAKMAAAESSTGSSFTSFLSSIFGLGSSSTSTGSASALSSSDYFSVDSSLALYHKGGMVGESRAYRLVPSAAFSGAPRYHSGIGPGESAAILQDGEAVFTPGQMKALGSNLGTTNYNVTIQAVDSKSFTDMVNKNPGAIVNIMGNSLKDNTSMRYLMKKAVR